MFNNFIEQPDGTYIKVIDQTDNEDIIKEACLRAMKDSGYSLELYNENILEETIASYQINQYPHRIMIALYNKDKDKILGIICGIKDSGNLFFGDSIVYEQVWWVDKNYKGRSGLKLLSYYEQWAEMVGAKVVQVSVLSANDSSETLSKWYKKKGYKELERSYLKEIK